MYSAKMFIKQTLNRDPYETFPKTTLQMFASNKKKVGPGKLVGPHFLLTAAGSYELIGI